MVWETRRFVLEENRDGTRYRNNSCPYEGLSVLNGYSATIQLIKNILRIYGVGCTLKNKRPLSAHH